MNTQTLVTYGEGGWDDAKPNLNIVEVTVTTFNADGEPVESETVDPAVYLANL